MKTSATYRIPAQAVPEIEAGLVKMNKRARKLGLPEITWTVVKEEFEEKDDFTVQKWITAEFTGAAPVFKGWRLIAVLDHLTGTEGTIINVVPGIEFDVTNYRGAGPWCDHCQQNRIRIQTFIVQHKDGSVKQVGRSCMKDFLGGATPEGLFAMAELWLNIDHMIANIDDDYMQGRGLRVDLWNTLYVLSLSANWVKTHGYVSRAKAEEWGKQATADVIKQTLVDNAHCTERQGHCKDACHVHIFPDADDEALATTVLEWVRNWDDEHLNDYQYNAYTVCKGQGVHMKHVGIAASTIAAWNREQAYQERKKEEQRVAAGKSNEWLGKEGDRLELKGVRFVRSYPFENDFGCGYFNHFEDSQGNKLTWKTGDTFNEGTYTIRGTVKGHDEYNGRKATILTRCKLTDFVAATA